MGVRQLLLFLLAISALLPPVLADVPRRPWLDPSTGKPFFPLGWFEWEGACISGPTGQESLARAKASLDEMALEGVNLVIFVNSWSGPKSDDQLKTNLGLLTAYLDHAQRKGIRVQVQLDGTWVNAFRDHDKVAIALLLQWAKAISQHPALLGYQLWDEPESSSAGKTEKEAVQRHAFVQALIRMYDAIRACDTNKNHAVQVVFNLVPHSDWTKFLPALDAFQIDRYPINRQFPYFPHGRGTVGDWGAMRVSWQIAHAVAAIENTSHRNPAPVLQGVGLSYYESGYHWRDPLYEETRYMAYSSLTVGGWGVIHWIRNVSPAGIRRNVARLHAELRQLVPAFERSWEKPPFTVSHNHEGITRDWLADRVPDISTLALEDERSYYLIASDNSGVFEDVTFRMKLPNIKGVQPRQAAVLSEDWSREVAYDSRTGEWVIPKHTMIFGDINIWVVPKESK
jgi:hypothetical protein